MCPAGALIAESLVALTPADARLALRCALDLPTLRADVEQALLRASAAEGERDAARASLRSLEGAAVKPAIERTDRLWQGIAWGIVAGTVGSVATAAGIVVWTGR